MTPGSYGASTAQSVPVSITGFAPDPLATNASTINSLVEIDTTFGGTGDPRQFWQARAAFVFLVWYNGCLADFNKDTVVDLNDFFLFFNAFDADDCGL